MRLLLVLIIFTVFLSSCTNGTLIIMPNANCKEMNVVFSGTVKRWQYNPDTQSGQFILTINRGITIWCSDSEFDGESLSIINPEGKKKKVETNTDSTGGFKLHIITDRFCEDYDHYHIQVSGNLTSGCSDNHITDIFSSQEFDIECYN